MPTIEIDDSLIPKGYEVPSGAEVSKFSTGFNGAESYIAIRIPIRRKPRKLKAIVFEVSGEARQIRRGEWANGPDGPWMLCSMSMSTEAHIPLTRREVYEGDEDGRD